LYTKPLEGLSSSDLHQILTITRENRYGAPDRIRDLLYPFGFYVVERIGIAGLRDLCERADQLGLDTVPLEWFRDDLPAPR
jgi:hypothetical protein